MYTYSILPFLPSEIIYTKIQLEQPYLSTKDLFDKTFSEYQYRRPVKYHPLLYQQRCELMCICDVDRVSNWFLFNYTTNNDCENGGEYFQNNETCPTKLTCICPSFVIMVQNVIFQSLYHQMYKLQTLDRTFRNNQFNSM